MLRWMWLLLILALVGAPLRAQDEDDDTEIEVGEGSGGDPVDKTKPKPKPESEKPRPVPPGHPPRGGDDEKGNPATIEEINAAIDKGVAWLRQRQGEDGSWGPCVSSGSYTDSDSGPRECYRIGPTAFSIFTLRKCGVPRKDKGIKAGLKWLEARCRDAVYASGDKGYRYTSYESSAIVMMLVALNEPDLPPGKKKDEKRHRFSKSPSRPPPGVRFKRDEWQWMDDRIRHLIDDGRPNKVPFQNRGGGWRYWHATGDQDLSATQFALLGLRAASEAGYPVHEVAAETWADAAKCAGSLQDDLGGFHYQANTPWTLGMTAAGIASLLICKEQMQLAGQAVPGDLDSRVERGLAFLGERIDFTRNLWDGMETATKAPHGIGYHYYYLYGIERVGALSGKKELGGKAWYPRGATFLVRNQQNDGKWVDATCMNPKDVLGTCFALLFLKKATPPAVTISR